MKQPSQNGGQGDPGSRDDHGGFNPQEEDIIASSPVSELQLASEELWTMDELLEATPCDILEIDEEKLEARLNADGDAPLGLVEGGEPEAGEPQEDEETQATSGGYNYPPPFTRYEIFDDYRVFPYRAVGKLFFKRGGRSYVCSAASIGNNAIWTAGHCLHSGNNRKSGWATNVVFIPAYRDGQAPYGQWQAKQLFTSRTWYSRGNPNGLSEDWGGAILYPRGGRKISQRVGWLGFAWNWSRYQHWHSLGYPAASPFNGKRLQCATGSFAYTGKVNGTDTNGMGNDLTGGSSGGPWIMRFGSNNYLNGNNSYRRRGKPQEMFSPYMNTKANNFRKLIISKNA